MLCLDGLKVIDMCNRLNGSYAAMFLGDFGADVICVDRPEESVGFVSGVPEGRLAPFWCTDRNKRNIVLNLKNKAAFEVFIKLVKQSDVLIEGNRPGVMEKLGLNYDTLSKENPRLIYASLSGFGQDGPYRLKPGHDNNFLALSGALSMIGERNGQPYTPSNLVGDIGGAGMHALAGILLAIIARERTGRGQYVDISYLDATMSLLSFDISSYYAKGKVPRRGETISTNGELHSQIYRCKDGQYFATGAAEPKFWANLCRTLGCEDLIADRGSTGERMLKCRAILAKIFAEKTRDEWAKIFENVDTCASPVNNIDEAVRDPQILARNMIVEMEDPVLGKVALPGLAIKLSDTPGSIRSLGVPKGTNTEEIVMELGYSNDEIAAMKTEGAIGLPEK